MVHDDVQIIVFSTPCLFAYSVLRGKLHHFLLYQKHKIPSFAFSFLMNKLFTVTAKTMNKTEKKARTGEGALPSQVNGNFLIYPFILEL